VLTVAEAHSGELSQVLLRISGVLTAGSKEMDENAAFIHIKKAQSIFNIGQNYHEIAIKFRDRSVGEQETYPLWAQLNHTGNKGESWKGIVASFTEIMGMVDQSKGIMAFILMLLVGVGIVNTLFMSIYERMFEFAVLRALGTKSREIIIMVMSEAGAMAVMSVVLGLIITVILALPLGLSGIDYGGMEFADVTIREPIFYEFHWSQITSFPVATFMFTVLISIYPAYHAAKVTMAQAIKKTL